MLKRSRPLKRTEFKRKRKPRHVLAIPVAKGVARGFDSWVRAVVKVRDGGRCRRCSGPGTDCAHIFGLGMGRSRENPRQWRNWPAARVLLCNLCHMQHDQGRDPWTWESIGIDLMEAESRARRECAEGDMKPVLFVEPVRARGRR